MSGIIRSSAMFVYTRDHERQGRLPSLFICDVTSGPEVIDPTAMFVYITWL